MEYAYKFSSVCQQEWDDSCAMRIMDEMSIKSKVLSCYNDSFEKGDKGIYIQDNKLLKQERE